MAPLPVAIILLCQRDIFHEGDIRTTLKRYINRVRHRCGRLVRMDKSIGNVDLRHAGLVFTLNMADTAGSGSARDAQHSLRVLCLRLLFFDSSFFMRSICLVLSTLQN